MSQTLSAAWDTPDASECFITGADFDSDGKFDVAVSCTRFGGTKIMRSQGNGQFTDTGTISKSFQMRAADLNTDGIVDLVGRVNINGQITTNTWLNTGGATFASGVQYPDMGAWLETGDLNGDGWVDLASSLGSQVGVMLNQGNGIFGAAKMYPAGAGSAEMTLGDWNADDRLDMAVQNATSITLHFNSCLP